MTLSDLQTFITIHQDHTLSFDSQEFIECVECEETFILPEGTGVNIVEGDQPNTEIVLLEVPSGIAGGHVTYIIDLATRLVVL